MSKFYTDEEFFEEFPEYRKPVMEFFECESWEEYLRDYSPENDLLSRLLRYNKDWNNKTGYIDLIRTLDKFYYLGFWYDLNDEDEFLLKFDNDRVLVERGRQG